MTSHTKSPTSSNHSAHMVRCRPPSPALAEATPAEPAQTPLVVHTAAVVQPQQAILPPPATASGGHSAVGAAAVPHADIQLSPATAALLSQVTQGLLVATSVLVFVSIILCLRVCSLR